MKCAILSVVALAAAVANAGVAPYPASQQSSLSIDEAKTYCPGGDVACCQNADIIKSDGVLTGLLAKGLLHNLLGNEDSSCAKFDLISELNILSVTTQGVNGVQCSSTTACCTGDSCEAIA